MCYSNSDAYLRLKWGQKNKIEVKTPKLEFDMCGVYLNNSVTKYLLNIHLSFKFKASEETATPQHLQARLDAPCPVPLRSPQAFGFLSDWPDRTKTRRKRDRGESKRERLRSDSVTVKLRIWETPDGHSSSWRRLDLDGVRNHNRSHPALSVTARRQES